jgi:hypothetical protein
LYHNVCVSANPNTYFSLTGTSSSVTADEWNKFLGDIQAISVVPSGIYNVAGISSSSVIALLPGIDNNGNYIGGVLNNTNITGVTGTPFTWVNNANKWFVYIFSKEFCDNLSSRGDGITVAMPSYVNDEGWGFSNIGTKTQILSRCKAATLEPGWLYIATVSMTNSGTNPKNSYGYLFKYDMTTGDIAQVTAFTLASA